MSSRSRNVFILPGKSPGLAGEQEHGAWARSCAHFHVPGLIRAPRWLLFGNGWESLEQGNPVPKGSGDPPGAVDVPHGAGPALSKLGCASLCPSLAEGKSPGECREAPLPGGDSGCPAGGSQDMLLDTFQGHWHQQIKELSLQSLPWIFFPSQHQNPSLFLVLIGAVL